MTMLDRMRRHRNWLKWSLAIVVLAFVFLYIPDFLAQPGVGNQEVVATVEGREITVARFRRAYQQQMQAYRQAYGQQMDERLLRQLGIDQRIVQQLIEEEAALAEARRLGISASDAEVRARIMSLPAFLEDGQWAGDQRYRQILNMQNPPLRPNEFEEQVRRSITIEKLQGALTDWMTVTDADVDAEFRRRNEQVRLVLVHFPADRFAEDVTVTDDEVAAHFEANRERYRQPEKRQVRYAIVDMQAIRERTQVTDEDVRRYYDDNEDQFSTPEQVRASHILLRTEGRDEAEVRKQAEGILAKARAGADFAKLAAQHTEEEAGKERGGDLDYFGRGQMVPAFEEAAFALEPGQVSDIVETQFGLHIIKVTDRREAAKRSLEEVRPQIEDQLRWERAQAEAQRTADDIARSLRQPADFEAVARPRGLTVGESGLFARDEPIPGIGMAPAVAERAFELRDGQVSEPIRTPQGFTFITVTGRQDARLPELDEVRARAQDDLRRERSVDAARQKAASVADSLVPGKFEAAAKAAGLEVQTTEMIARGAPLPGIGVSPAVEAAAFSLPAGAVSEPIVTDAGAAIVRVLERKDVSPEQIAEGRPQLREELLNERRNRFLGNYMARARERMRIDINRHVLAQLTA